MNSLLWIDVDGFLYKDGRIVGKGWINGEIGDCGQCG
jgi:hypothetical protein